MKFVSISLFFCLFTHLVLGQTATREIKIEKGQTYLNLPVNNSGDLLRAKIKYDGNSLDEFTIKLAEDPEFWVFFDVSDYQGKTITLEIENVPQSFRGGQVNVEKASQPEALNTQALEMVFADAKFPGQDSIYKEQNRPQVHFSSQRGWLNDPNGLVYYNDEYHLYYQHNPYGWEWGNMHWGHAVSKDLMHWQELKDAIFPVLTLEGDRRDAAFSGSAVVDAHNTSGFRKNGIDPLIAIYTSTGRGECIKLSYDQGKTFEDYEGNPVLKHNGRDPKVFWYEPGNHWVMVVWDQSDTKKLSLGQEATVYQHLIYNSPDLKNWTYQSGVPGFFECPELFELPVEGEPGTSKWVMYDASGRYIVGDFDGKHFTIEQDLKKYAYGGAYFYASQTYNNLPDDRRIQVGWGRNITHPGMPFNQAMLFPAELKLKKTFDGLRLCPTPIREISALHKNSQIVENKIITADTSVRVPVQGDAIHLIAEFEKGDAQFALNILGYELSYNDLLGEFTTALSNPASGGVPAGPFPPPTAELTTVNYVKPGTELFKIEAIVDKNIIEFYINDGELYYVAPFDVAKTGQIEVSVKGRRNNRKSILKKMEVHELSSIWSYASVGAE